MAKLNTAKLAGHNGTYSLFIDDSSVPSTNPAQPIYCMVIQSRYKNAPINTVVTIENSAELEATFGKRDHSQERNGNYSMLLAKLMLEAQDEPMYIVNIRDYDNTKTTEIISLNTEATESNDAVESVIYTSLFDRSKMWKMDRERLITDNATNALNFASIRSNNFTIYVRNASELPSTFDDTIGDVKARFSTLDLSHIPDETLVSDLFVDVYVFGRDLTNSLATGNPSLSGILDNTGHVLKNPTVNVDVDQLEELSKLSESGFLGKFTGTAVQELLSITGESYYLENIVNGSAKTTGLALSIDQSVVSRYADWDISNGAQPLSISHNVDVMTGVAGSESIAPMSTLSYVDTNTITNGSNALTQKAFTGLSASIYDEAYSDINDETAGGNWDKVNLTSQMGIFENTVAPISSTGLTGGSALTNEFYYFGDNYKISVGSKIVAADSTLTDVVKKTLIGEHRQDADHGTVELIIDPTTDLVFPKNSDGNWIYPSTWAQDAGLEVTFSGSVAQDSVAGGTPIGAHTADAATFEAIQVIYGLYTPIYRVKTRKAVRGITGNVTTGTLTIHNTFDRSATPTNITDISDNPATIVISIPPEKRFTSYTPFVLNGVTLDATQFCDGSATKQSEILDMLETTSFKNELLDTDKLQFKLLVDGFKTYVEPTAKRQLSKLADKSKRYAYIGSLPFFKDFDNSINPYFKDSASEIVDPKYIVSGGNESLPFTNSWSMPNTEELGDYASMFVSSNLVYSDGVKNTEIPSGPIVALNYGLNFLRTGRAPYTVVGGSSTGVINVSGITSLSKEYSLSERDVLEPNGYNLIIEGSTGELMIFNSASAKQSPKTALSSFENTMLVMYIASEMDKIIKPTMFKRNTSELRDAKLLEANAFCKQLMTAGAIESYINVCNTDNNDAELRAQGYFVLDTEITALGGIKIAVQRTIIKSLVD